MPQLTMKCKDLKPKVMDALRLFAVALAICALPITAASIAQAQDAAEKSKAKSNAASEAAGNQQSQADALDGQAIDLQIAIGTLESLAAQPGQAGPESQQIQSLETRLQSIESQIKQLGAKARNVGKPAQRSRTVQAPETPPVAPETAARPGTAGGGWTNEVHRGAEQSETAAAPSYEIQPGAILPPIDGSAPNAIAGGQQPGPGQQTAAVQPDATPVDPANAKHDYEVAYSQMINRKYAEAQVGFANFMRLYPNSSLVPNALYWLGETHYQQRNFAEAAEAFDLVTRMYASSPKAADSQLKRALSYSALGKNDEACQALSVLGQKFQNAPGYVVDRAGNERRRLGCTG